MSKTKAQLEKELELARILLVHAVGAKLDSCGNSYVNAYTQQWLAHAKIVGAYHGPVIGAITDVKQQWEQHLEENGLPDWK